MGGAVGSGREREGEFAIFEAPKNGPRVAGAGGPRAGKINMAGAQDNATRETGPCGSSLRVASNGSLAPSGVSYRVRA
jgi:hypothetical protein